MTRLCAAVRATIATLEVEQHGRLDGRARLATIVFPNGSIASVPPELSVPVWQGMRERTAEHG